MKYVSGQAAIVVCRHTGECDHCVFRFKFFYESFAEFIQFVFLEFHLFHLSLFIAIDHCRGLPGKTEEEEKRHRKLFEDLIENAKRKGFNYLCLTSSYLAEKIKFANDASSPCGPIILFHGSLANATGFIQLIECYNVE